MRAAKRIQAEVAKLRPAARLAFGRAYTSRIQGRPVVDADGDVVEPHELERAAHGYIARRAAKVLHQGRVVGEVVESYVATEERAADLGLAPGHDEAWHIGMRVDCPETWARVENGELREFSFGGSGDRQVIERPADAYVAKGAPERTTALTNLDIEEISLVPAGAGERVAVALAKGHKMLEKLTFRPELLSTDARAKVTKALPAELRARLSKREVLTLADVEDALPEELFTVVLQAIDAAQMHAARPAAEAPTPAPAEEDKADEHEAEEHKMDEEPEKVDEEMMKAHPAFRGLLEKAQRLETVAAEERKRREAFERRYEEERMERARERYDQIVKERFAGLPMEHDALREVVMQVEAVAKGAEDEAVVSLAKADAAELLAGLERAASALKSSSLFGRMGTVREGAGGGAAGELEAAAAKLAKEKSWHISKARVEVARQNPDLHRRVQAERVAAVKGA